jgi:hypothetical protein
MTRIEAEEQILELLANAPSSFAALYGFVARGATAPRPSVQVFLEMLAASNAAVGYVVNR